MEKYILEYINENEFRKIERNLKKYAMFAFKKLNFEYYPKLRSGEFQGELVYNKEGTKYYELELPSDKNFKKIYGDIILKYRVYKEQNIVMLDTITPTDILLEGNITEITTYKGIMISKSNASKDMFKVDLLNMLQK